MILPTNRKDKYDCVKKYLCVDCPTPSQCVVSRTISKPQALMTVATKIALQMNCKMGGELWSVEIPVRLSNDCGCVGLCQVSDSKFNFCLSAQAADDCRHRLLP